MSFSWPWQYDFPPFFTIQPNLETRKKQVETWCSLVLAYYRHQRKFIMDVQEALQSSEIFHNKKIHRRLNADSVRMIMEELRKQGRVEWLDAGPAGSAGSGERCYVLWRTVEEWAEIIYQWVVRCGYNNTVCTLYQLQEGEETAAEEFHGLDSTLLTRALQHLQAQRKAHMMGTDGVKFL